ncbi:DUF4214 domain-containing protein [Pseudomonas sp. NW5]|uniref:DUF4214 domain-containing protein n=1 Tax=Pseudomonas sp. NW5 TaxID=2934934 RepID=UPI0020214CB9|nr:DUF4214 domain-containing protein [Pseudomonas sp. NW5]MCL7461865.1 DUF4214 domain-containing protein [Pseudomonas sp. NW5]
MAITSAQVQQLYVGYLGRAADQAGLDYWLAELNNPASGLTLENLRANFVNEQPEYANTYAGLTVTQTVAKIYENLFERAAEPAGLAYWVGEVEAGRVPVDQLIVAFLNSASAADRLVVDNKVQVAQSYTTTAGANFTAAAAADAIAAVDATSQSVQAALANIQAGSITGNVYVLDANVNSLQGTAGNDTFLANAASLQFADSINGGAGNDTLKLTVSNADYTASEITAGFKLIEPRTTSVEVLEVTARTSLSQNAVADTLADGINGGNNAFTDPAATSGGNRDSDTVDTIITLSSAPDLKVIASIDSELSGSALTFNDIQTIDGTRIRIIDTNSAHNFLFDDEAATAGNDKVTLDLAEARGLTINFGETPATGVSVNQLPTSTTFANAANPALVGEANALGISNNDGQGRQGVSTSLPTGFYGQDAASQSEINTLTINSFVQEPAGASRNYRNEVVDLNIGNVVDTLNITGDAQLKIGLAFQQEQEVLASNTRISTVNVVQQLAVADTTGEGYDYGVVPALDVLDLSNSVLRDFALSSASYALDASIRTVNAGAHFAGVDQAQAAYAALPTADLTLDISNGVFDAAGQVFNYIGSQGDDSVNFGVRTINKIIDLGTGNDTVVAGRGNDLIRGGAGDDVIKHNNTENSFRTLGQADSLNDGYGFAAGQEVTVYGGEGNDQVVIAGQVEANMISLVDLGNGDDTLYVEDSADGDLNDAGDAGVANNRIAGGLGQDTIIVTTAGNRLPTDTVLDLVIYGDNAVTGEHLVEDLNAPALRGVRGEEVTRAARDVNANFVADSYFANAALAGTAADSDRIYVNDINNTYANLGNGDNVFVQRGLNGNGVLDAIEGAAAAAAVLPASDVTVDAGNGNDTVAIYTNGIKQVNTRGGNDVIDLVGTGNVTVLAGEGDDRVVVSSVSTAPIANAPANYIDLGAGDDTLTVTTKGVVNGVTEIYGRTGRDVVSILNADTTVDTDHTLHVELGADADVMLMRARDLKNDDTISGGNDGSIDQFILVSNDAGRTQEAVTFSDSSRVEGFELFDLRGAGAGTAVAATTAELRQFTNGGVNFTLTENLIARMDQNVSVGDVTNYVYGAALPVDGAAQGTDGNNDGLFTAGVLGNMNAYNTTGVLTVTTVEHGVNDDDIIIESNNALNLTQTLDLRALGDVLNSPTSVLSADRSFVNFLGGTARDVVVVDERSFNSFSNLRFDEFDLAAANLIDEDNSTQDTLLVVANTVRNEVTDISFGDYRNVQGLDAVALVDQSATVNSTFRLEASEFLANQATSSLVPGALNAAGGAQAGLLVTIETADAVEIYGAAGASVTFTGGVALAAPVTLDTVDGQVQLVGVDANSFLITAV